MTGKSPERASSRLGADSPVGRWAIWGAASLFFAAAAAILVVRGTVLSGDSASYLNAAAFRPALYPLFLDVIDLLTGGGAEQYAHLFQIALGAAAVFLATRTLSSLFRLRPAATVAVAICLIVPYFRYAPFANLILSEGLAYPLFLFCVATLLRALAMHSVRAVATFLALAVALSLVRKQFLFLFPLGLALGLHAWLVQGRPLRAALIVAASAAALAAAPLADRAAALIARGDSYRYPLTAVQLVTLPVYASPRSAAEQLSPTSRDIFLAVRAQLDQRSISFESFRAEPWPNVDIATHYARSYAEAFHIILSVAIEKLFGKVYVDIDDFNRISDLLTPGEAERLDDTLGTLWLELLRAAPEAAVQVYVRNVMYFLGGPIAVVFYAFLGAIAAYGALVRRSDFAWCIGTVLAAHMGNFLLVALVEPIYPRYSLYTDALMLAALTIVAVTAFRSREGASGRLGPPGDQARQDEMQRVPQDGHDPHAEGGDEHSGLRKLVRQ